MKRLLLASVIALATLSSAAEAKDWFVTKITHYNVHGSTPRELLDQMYKRGVKVPDSQKTPEEKKDGRRNVAAVAFKMLDGRYSPCWLKIEANIMMPRWKEYDKASPQLQKEWDDFYAYVLKHERQHIQNKRDYTSYIKKRKCADKAIATAWDMAHVKDVALDASVKWDTDFEKHARGENYAIIAPASDVPKWELKIPPEVNRALKRSLLNGKGRKAHHDAAVVE